MTNEERTNSINKNTVAALRFIGRALEIISEGGEQISPAEQQEAKENLGWANQHLDAAVDEAARE